MLEDGYGNPVTTRSDAARAAYAGGCDRLIGGQPAAALDLIRQHLVGWPRDAFIAALAANRTGLIGMSGRAGREAEQLAFLEALRPHYPDDPWFDGHYGMSLSELGHHDAARPRVERSLALQAQNAYAAHACAHLHYETDAAEAGTAFLTGWLGLYPPEGALRGHLNWHLALAHLGEGRMDEGLRLFCQAFASADYRGPALIKMLDAPSFLWRLELAGQPHDAARWQQVRAHADAAFPAPGVPFADWHVALTDAATGRGGGLTAGAAGRAAFRSPGSRPRAARDLDRRRTRAYTPRNPGGSPRPPVPWACPGIAIRQRVAPAGDVGV